MSHTTQRINLNPPYTYLLYLAYAPIFGEWRGGVFQCDGRFPPARYIVLSSKKYGMRIYHASGPEARQSEARRFFQPWQGWGHEAPSDPGRTKRVNACMLLGIAKRAKCSKPKEASVELLAQVGSSNPRFPKPHVQFSSRRKFCFQWNSFLQWSMRICQPPPR